MVTKYSLSFLNRPSSWFLNYNSSKKNYSPPDNLFSSVQPILVTTIQQKNKPIFSWPEFAGRLVTYLIYAWVVEILKLHDSVQLSACRS